MQDPVGRRNPRRSASTTNASQSPDLMIEEFASRNLDVPGALAALKRCRL